MPSQKEISSSNHPFSGAMVVSGRAPSYILMPICTAYQGCCRIMFYLFLPYVSPRHALPRKRTASRSPFKNKSGKTLYLSYYIIFVFFRDMLIFGGYVEVALSQRTSFHCNIEQRQQPLCSLGSRSSCFEDMMNTAVCRTSNDFAVCTTNMYILI